MTAPTDFEVSLTSTTGFGASVTLTQSGGSVASTPVFVRMNAASEGTPSGDITHTSAGATTVNVAVFGSVVAIPDEWVAYNDMNTMGGAANPPDVTEFDYSESGSLVDLGTGVVLPVTVSGSTVGVVGLVRGWWPGCESGVGRLSGVWRGCGFGWDRSVGFGRVGDVDVLRAGLVGAVFGDVECEPEQPGL